MTMYRLRDVDNRDDEGAPWETTGTLPELAGYIDGPLLGDLSSPDWWGDEVLRIADEMRSGLLSDNSMATLLELGVTITEVGESTGDLDWSRP